MKCFLLLIYILLQTLLDVDCTKPNITSVELDESQIDRLKLTIRWSTNTNENLDRFLVSYDKVVYNPQKFTFQSKPILSDLRRIFLNLNFFLFHFVFKLKQLEVLMIIIITIILFIKTIVRP